MNNNFIDGNQWSLNVNEIPIGTLPIKAIYLNSILKDNKLNTFDLLKIDIEGSEFKIFNKDSDISFLDFTKSIAIEIHSEFGNEDELIKIISNKGFDFIKSGEYWVGLNKSYVNI